MPHNDRDWNAPWPTANSYASCSSYVQSDPVPILAGVLQGQLLGPLLFLVYINDIVCDIDSSIRVFADDTAVYVIAENPATASAQLNKDLDTIHIWAEHRLVSFKTS